MSAGPSRAKASAHALPIISDQTPSTWRRYQDEVAPRNRRKGGGRLRSRAQSSGSRDGRDRVRWRVIVEVSSSVGAKQVHEVYVGGNGNRRKGGGQAARRNGH